LENPISIYTDHKNLEYFTTTKLLNWRQARWAQYLSQFNFKIIYRPGKSGAKPDALTRRSGDLPKEGDKRLTENFHAVIKPHQILRLECAEPARQAAEPVENTRITELFTEAYNWDPFPNQVLDMLRRQIRYCKDITLAECTQDLSGKLL
jgi:hypothetical protein